MPNEKFLQGTIYAMWNHKVTWNSVWAIWHIKLMHSNGTKLQICPKTVSSTWKKFSNIPPAFMPIPWILYQWCPVCEHGSSSHRDPARWQLGPRCMWHLGYVLSPYNTSVGNPRAVPTGFHLGRKQGAHVCMYMVSLRRSSKTQIFLFVHNIHFSGQIIMKFCTE